MVEFGARYGLLSQTRGIETDCAHIRVIKVDKGLLLFPICSISRELFIVMQFDSDYVVCDVEKATKD